MRRFVLSILTLLLLTGCAARRSQAQFIGYTSPQTVQATLFTNTACAAAFSTLVPNLGQSIHTVTFTVSGTNIATVRVQGSFDGVIFFPISDQTTGGSGIVTGAGYYPVVRFAIVSCTGGTLSASYAGTSVAPGFLSGFADVSVYQKNAFNTQSMGSSATGWSNSFVTTPYGSTSGVLIVGSTGAFPAGSSITVSSNSGGVAGSLPVAVFALPTNGANPITFQVPSISADSVNVVYTSGGASANTFNATYLFQKPGAQSSAANCDKWTPINTTANVQIITAPSSQHFIRVCSINLVVGAADNVALVEGTGATCGTGTLGMAGGATAATGWNLAANGGIAHGSGYGAIAKTAVAGDNVCLLVSAVAQVSGTIGWTASGIF